MKRHLRSIVALVGIAVFTSSSVGLDAKPTERRSGGKAVAHRGGRHIKSDALPTARAFSIGQAAIEPTIGIASDGGIYVAAAAPMEPAQTNVTDVMFSKDRGETWRVASPRVLGRNAHPVTIDPYVFVDRVDRKRSRVFTIDLTVECSYLSFSDDRGLKWTTNPLACGRPVNDHQTLFAGRPVTSKPVGYPHVLYYCFSDVATSQCTKSLDGGLSFVPTGAPAFVGYSPDGEGSEGGLCGGLHGHGVVDRKGTIYLPREYCGVPVLAISRDEGLTWATVEIGPPGTTVAVSPGGRSSDPSVAVDDKGNIYYVWVDSEDQLPYLSVSTNRGRTWSDPERLSPPGVKEANLATVTVGGTGKIAVAYYGSTNAPIDKCKVRFCSGNAYDDATWNGYLTIGTDVLRRRPSLVTALANDQDDPLTRGWCGPGRCSKVMDFIDVEIAPDGTPYAVYVDACMSDCVAANGEDYEGVVMKLVGGRRLR